MNPPPLGRRWRSTGVAFALYVGNNDALGPFVKNSATPTPIRAVTVLIRRRFWGVGILPNPVCIRLKRRKSDFHARYAKLPFGETSPIGFGDAIQISNAASRAIRKITPRCPTRHPELAYREIGASKRLMLAASRMREFTRGVIYDGIPYPPPPPKPHRNKQQTAS